jgi:hypothetical protein
VYCPFSTEFIPMHFRIDLSVLRSRVCGEGSGLGVSFSLLPPSSKPAGRGKQIAGPRIRREAFLQREQWDILPTSPLLPWRNSHTPGSGWGAHQCQAFTQPFQPTCPSLTGTALRPSRITSRSRSQFSPNRRRWPTLLAHAAIEDHPSRDRTLPRIDRRRARTGRHAGPHAWLPPVSDRPSPPVFTSGLSLRMPRGGRTEHGHGTCRNAGPARYGLVNSSVAVLPPKMTRPRGISIPHRRLGKAHRRCPRLHVTPA